MSTENPVRDSTAGSAARWILLALLLALGSWLRLRHVGPALLFGDEFHSLRDMQGGYFHVLSHFSQTGAGLALPLLQKILIDVFGDSHWVLRAPSWLAGLGLLFLVYPLVRHRFGQTAALLATAWVAVSPLLVFYSHFARIYSLLALLGLILLIQLESLLDQSRVSARRLFTLAVCTALLPWAHPTALGFVVPVYLAAILSAATAPDRTRDERQRRVVQLVSALTLAGALCLLAYLPSYESLWHFVRAKAGADYYGDFGLLDMLTLVAGNRPGAWALLLAAGAATGIWLQDRGVRGSVLVMAVVGPFLALAVARPYGDAYAYARYSLPALAPLGILLAVGLGQVLASFGIRAAGAVRATGLAAVALLWLTGPLAPGSHPSAPQHANTYLSLLTLPAFDAAWPETPHFYRRLPTLAEGANSQPLRVIELPALTNRTRHLYRHYQLQHGAETVLAAVPGEFPRLPRGPYVSPTLPGWLEAAEADYLIVHVDLAGEVARYWSWLYGPQGPGPFGPEVAAHMERHEQYGGPLPSVSPEWRGALSASLGEPIHRDRYIEVWRLENETPR